MGPAASPAGCPAHVAQGEHPDAPGLAVAFRHEPDRTGRRGRLAQGGGDPGQLADGPVAEECEREVQVLARHRAAPRDVGALPLRQRGERGSREPQRAEEPCTFTAFKASREVHAPSSRLCVN